MNDRFCTVNEHIFRVYLRRPLGFFFSVPNMSSIPANNPPPEGDGVGWAEAKIDCGWSEEAGSAGCEENTDFCWSGTTGRVGWEVGCLSFKYSAEI